MNWSGTSVNQPICSVFQTCLFRSWSKDSRDDKNDQDDIVREAGPNVSHCLFSPYNFLYFPFSHCPQGQLYAKVKRPAGKKVPASSSHRGSDMEDQMSEAMSHASSQFVQNAM